MRDATSETDRLAALASLEILDTPPQREFDTIVATAQRMLGCKSAFISLIDDTRQWFKAQRGLGISQTPISQAFCTHALAADDILVVPDATCDPRFDTNPLVTGAPNIRFYAGMPIRAQHASGVGRLPIGTLCVIDPQPRALDEAEERVMRDLAHLAEALLDARGIALTLARLAEDRRRTLERLDRTDRQFRQAERMANIGSWRLSLADSRPEWSEQTYAIHGVPIADGTPSLTTALDFYPPQARPGIESAVARTIATGEPFDFETDFINAQGKQLRVRSMAELEVREGVPVALVGVFQDVTARYAMEQALRHTAHTDELTKLASRSRFNQFLDDKLAVAWDRQEAFALLLIDLDHFKAVNDLCGHLTGDAVLRLMAARLQAPSLDDSFAARLGGDEFVLVVTSPTLLMDLEGLLRRLLFDLRHSVTTDSASIAVSATIGACLRDKTTKSRSDMVQRADQALYRAKNRQRGLAAIAGVAGFVEHQGGPFALQVAV
ncbi:diguanylate cyclase [Methylobacterium sp. BTF04]|uniref:diguanylate cyclase domain-containing protein n=1 Tax=Methylobacterium sp. BTF04 TaxID=2708300 RepID=UPI0013D5550C|nr:diguanylate cyclase [Methylobacterium sp. BTF04]NEU10718.1 diguanylate cyclase [Methylobacterium sp. BTF04]